MPVPEGEKLCYGRVHKKMTLSSAPKQAKTLIPHCRFLDVLLQDALFLDWSSGDVLLHLQVQRFAFGARNSGSNTCSRLADKTIDAEMIPSFAFSTDRTLDYATLPLLTLGSCLSSCIHRSPTVALFRLRKLESSGLREERKHRDAVFIATNDSGDPMRLILQDKGCQQMLFFCDQESSISREVGCGTAVGS